MKLRFGAGAIFLKVNTSPNYRIPSFVFYGQNKSNSFFSFQWKTPSLRLKQDKDNQEKWNKFLYFSNYLKSVKCLLSLNSKHFQK